jgi:4-aminobutyrate aminotransferase-like enzyme
MLLERHGAVLRAFGGRLNTLRISPNLMTEDQELERFLDVLTSNSS